MARLPRVYIESILYYVTSRGSHGQNVFSDPTDYAEYISLADRYKKQYSFKLFSYALLPNHLHMLIELKNNVGISNIMHDINSLYTKIFNDRYSRKGHLFEARFKAIYAEKEEYLLQLIRHIHLNPKRIGLVDNPDEYPHTSHSQYLNPAKRLYPDMRDETEEVFGMLKAREEVLDEYVSGADAKELNNLKNDLHKKRMLGSEDFTKKIYNIIDESVKQQQKKESPKKTRLLFILFAGTIMLTSVITVEYFHRQSQVIKSEHDMTIMVYKKTLEALQQDKKNAIKEDADIEYYLWKIGLTERALEDLNRDKEEALKRARVMDGYSWNVEFTQAGGPSMEFLKQDTIYFKGLRVTSDNLVRKGFSGSRYTKTVLRNGKVSWETMQRNKQGETASWRGEWDGKAIRGTLRRRWVDGIVRDFTFVSIGERTKE